MELKIDLDNLKRSGIFAHEFLLLSLINEGLDPKEYNLGSESMYSLQLLEDNLWIKPTENGYILRDKGRQLFETKESEVNFDEFFEAFPATTSDGRVLRSANKIFRGALTRDYVVCKKKYLSKVKSKEVHDEIVSIIKARVASGDTKYMNGLEVYINQENWSKDVKYLKTNSDWTTQRV